MRTIILTALLALAAGLARAQEVKAPPKGRPWRFFLAYDYFFPENSGQGLKDQFAAQSQKLLAQGYSSTQSTLNTEGGTGARFGVFFPMDKRSDLGVSFGYIIGPTMNGNFSAFGGPGFGGETINRTVIYLRYIAQSHFNFPVTEKLSFHMGSGLGLATGRVEQTCDQSGTVACPVINTRSTWTGFSWEFTPSVSYKLKAADARFGLRYAGFPDFNGNEQIAPIFWEAYGIFIGASF